MSTPPEPVPFSWIDHLKFPVRNEQGQVLPLQIVSEYMKEVRTLDEFQRAQREMLKHVLATPVSQQSIEDLQKELRRNFDEHNG